MHRSWLDKLRSGDIVLLDGGTGSELRRRGAAMTAGAWSGPLALTHRALLHEIHLDYLRAGADVIITNTFATTRFVLAAEGLADRFEEINRAAVDAALAARAQTERPVAVAGSISCLPPRFDPNAYPNPLAERNGYRELAHFLAEAGVDLIALEMMEDTKHAARAMEAALEVQLPLWLGVSARSTPGRGLVTFDYPQTPFAAVLEALVPMGPTVVNVMHTASRDVPASLKAVERIWSGPIGVYPEIDEGAEPSAVSSSDTSPEAFARAALGWAELSARMLGGCCGTTPMHIAALREALEAAKPHQSGIGIDFTPRGTR